MHIIQLLIDFIVHIDTNLGQLINTYHTYTYFIIGMIIFGETGLVVTPFLPGDSLIFASGAFSGLGSLNIYVLTITLILCAIAGNSSNYFIGKFIGKNLINKNSKFIKKEYIENANKFYEKYGGKAVIISRFIPICRTFIPFIAGVGCMNFKKFTIYNIIGATLWVLLFSLAGYFFGNLESVRHNFTLVIFAIIIISIIPAIIAFLKTKFAKISSNL